MRDPNFVEPGDQRLIIDIAIDRGPPRDCETAHRTVDPTLLGDRPIRTEIFPSVKPEEICDPVVRFTRSSEGSLELLRSLPRTANIVFLTPVIIPAGHVEKYNQQPTTDPFEYFGRELSKRHAWIRHVPYVAGYGFMSTHEDFIKQASAVIILVCEPHGDKKVQSLGNQMAFANAALSAAERRGRVADSIPVVLVQCCERELLSPPPEAFENVVESSTFNDDIAVRLAALIFSGTP